MKTVPTVNDRSESHSWCVWRAGRRPRAELLTLLQLVDAFVVLLHFAAIVSRQVLQRLHFVRRPPREI